MFIYRHMSASGPIFVSVVQEDKKPITVDPRPGVQPGELNPNRNLFFVNCAVTNRKFLVDTGAALSIIRPSDSTKLTPDLHPPILS